MSLAIGAASSIKIMGFDEQSNEEVSETNNRKNISGEEEEHHHDAPKSGGISRHAKTLDPEVKILSLAIKSPGRSDIVLSIPEDGNLKGTWFTLKEGSRYSLQFTFLVGNNIVSGLKYTNTVWKTGVKVDSAKEMLGTFSPQAELTHMRCLRKLLHLFVDDDNKCYLEINYTFDIRKEWLST
ncbi:hypothetical protein GH714_009479 [Hevea brasiliensis]|uniref:Uncharacterized protein n=1 Tax=Hevea brasiliensis TaxID=3981 RepID=A0A6A6M067_HEVBR|nr:hypothetical protein GH714_009479 [Hevea brasiliensis]